MASILSRIVSYKRVFDDTICILLRDINLLCTIVIIYKITTAEPVNFLWLEVPPSKRCLESEVQFRCPHYLAILRRERNFSLRVAFIAANLDDFILSRPPTSNTLAETGIPNVLPDLQSCECSQIARFRGTSCIWGSRRSSLSPISIAADVVDLKKFIDLELVVFFDPLIRFLVLIQSDC
jgi:hypothetical protein